MIAQPTIRPIDRLQARLPGVRECDRGWIARCPLHEGHSLNLSLSVRGSILLHCSSDECAPAQVLNAIGLELGDLYGQLGNPL